MDFAVISVYSDNLLVVYFGPISLPLRVEKKSSVQGNAINGWFWRISYTVLHQVDYSCSNKLLLVLICSKLTNHQTYEPIWTDPVD